MINTARKIAEKEHAGQTRRDGRTPYINHVADVARRLEGESQEVIAAAWLHDVLEDSDLYIEDLYRAELPTIVIEAVDALTHRRESYHGYLTKVRTNPIARKVKIADMQSNLADDPTEKQVARYTSGLAYLQAE